MNPRPIQRATGITGDADAWLTPGRFALVLAALIIVCFPGIIFGFETFWLRDFHSFGYPLAYYGKERLLHGELPLWNPLSCCGLPFLAQWNPMVLYPGSWLCFLFPLSWSLGVFCLAHLFLAGMGMYFLARRWTENPLAASVAGVLFAFNGLTWTALMWPNNIAALGWMPWVVLTVERAWRDGGRWMVIAGLAGAMQMLSGAPEIILFTWFVVGCCWVLAWFERPGERGRMLLRPLGVGLLVAGLSAAQLLPFLDLLAHSSRDATLSTAAETPQWSLPPSGWANYLVPLLHCYRVDFGGAMYYQESQFWTISYYVSIGALMFAALGFWRRRPDRRMLMFAGLAVLGVILATGENGPVYKWLKQAVPAVGFARYPVKFVILPTLLLPLLGALGLARWQAAESGKARGPTGATALLLAGIAAVVWWAWQHPATNHPGPAENPWDTTWSGVVRAAFLIGMAGCLALVRLAPGFQLQVLSRLSLLLLLWFDVFTHQPQLSPTIERDIYQPNIVRPALEWGNQLEPGKSRAMQTARAFAKLYYRGGTNVTQETQIRRLALNLNQNLLENIAKTDGFYSLELRPMHELFRVVALNTNDLPKLEDFLGIEEISNPTNGNGWVRRDTFRPMITAGEQPVFAEDADILRGLADGSLDPTHFVYLPAAERGEARAANAAEAKIVRFAFAAEHLEADVQAAAPAWVVVAQADYHPWRAYVDGQPVKLWRANYAFQALEVPEGQHTIRLVYQDRAFAAGGAISLATLGLCGIAGWRARRRARSSAAATSRSTA